MIEFIHLVLSTYCLFITSLFLTILPIIILLLILEYRVFDFKKYILKLFLFNQKRQFDVKKDCKEKLPYILLEKTKEIVKTKIDESKDQMDNKNDSNTFDK